MALNYNWSAMTTVVNAMSPGGNTNQAIGLQLGWQSLVGGGPFPTPPAMDANYNYSQVIILLTDGLNTQDRWYTSQTSIDTREKMTCDNINAAKITLYTVQVNTGGDPTSSLLQNCAGSPGKYPDTSKFFLLTSSSQILTTFNQIASNLSQLRIAKMTLAGSPSQRICQASHRRKARLIRRAFCFANLHTRKTPQRLTQPPRIRSCPTRAFRPG